MKRTNVAVWAVVALVVLYLAWAMIRPMLSALFFGAVVAYAFLPVHRRLSGKVGEFWSSILLASLLLISIVGVAIVAVMTLSDVLSSAYAYTTDVFEWLYSIGLPVSVETSIKNFQVQLLPLLQERLLSYTFSLPGYVIQSLVFLVFMQYLLVNSSEIRRYLRELIPTEERELAEDLVSGITKTLDALVRSWLLLNLFKGLVMTAGLIIFDVTDTGGAIVGGLLTVFFSFIPLFEGWMIWAIAAWVLVRDGFLLKGVLLAVYGFVLVSPLPDYTIRPRLVAKEARLDSTMVLLGMIGGAMAFGIKGIIAGPIIFNLLASLVREWKRLNRRRRSKG
ncbi:AI-2E family transporter [Palaeococcus ferrophilus]|uniref:AI-2E family transporter n=1 Tax=Palaeococcus ferrophilus TaxID=83868 RepID=UPI00064F5302|nr:AI-2E family transporter [Palaeococcus ferrophilus]